MFDLTTILTLIAPAVVAPILVLIALRALDRGDRISQAALASPAVTAFVAPEAQNGELIAEPVGQAQAQAA